MNLQSLHSILKPFLFLFFLSGLLFCFALFKIYLACFFCFCLLFCFASFLLWFVPFALLCPSGPSPPPSPLPQSKIGGIKDWGNQRLGGPKGRGRRSRKAKWLFFALQKNKTCIFFAYFFAFFAYFFAKQKRQKSKQKRQKISQPFLSPHKFSHPLIPPIFDWGRALFFSPQSGEAIGLYPLLCFVKAKWRTNLHIFCLLFCLFCKAKK